MENKFLLETYPTKRMDTDLVERIRLMNVKTVLDALCGLYALKQKKERTGPSIIRKNGKNKKTNQDVAFRT